MQYFSKKKLVLPEGYFVNSSQIPLAKEVNKLLANCGCETFPIKPLSEAMENAVAPSLDLPLFIDISELLTSTLKLDKCPRSNT